MEEYTKIMQFIDDQAKILVGILCKRIEVLEGEKVLTPKLYKSLIKENVYEQFRALKKLIEVYLKVGNVIFKTREEG